jgi:CelD/BcsL family acetyltransferase involved in cellulose biosynthesis
MSSHPPPNLPGWSSPTPADPAPAAAPLIVGEVRDAAGFHALEAEWRALYDRCPDLAPFQSWEWVEAWHRVFVPERPSGWLGNGWASPWTRRIRVLCARRPARPGQGGRGELVGILPLSISSYYGFPLRKLGFMGDPLSDYQETIAPADMRAACAAAFARHLGAAARDWELLDLPNLHESSPLAELPGLAGEAGRGHGTVGQVAVHRLCPVLRLPSTFDEVLKQLGKNLRANLGRRRRQLERLHGAVLDTVRDPDELPSAMTDLFALHNARWQERGVGGAFAAEEIQRFHRLVAARFLERGWLRLHRLSAGGRTGAALYCFARGGRVLYYLSGFDLELSKLSPGNVILGHAIASAIDEGAREFDFLRGDEGYKLEWTDHAHKTVRVLLGHGSAGSRATRLLYRAERRIETVGLKVQRKVWGRQAEAATAAATNGHAAEAPTGLRKRAAHVVEWATALVTVLREENTPGSAERNEEG